MKKFLRKWSIQSYFKRISNDLFNRREKPRFEEQSYSIFGTKFALRLPSMTLWRTPHEKVSYEVVYPVLFQKDIEQ
jgi:hypothetical protein